MLGREQFGRHFLQARTVELALDVRSEQLANFVLAHCRDNRLLKRPLLSVKMQIT